MLQRVFTKIFICRRKVTYTQSLYISYSLLQSLLFITICTSYSFLRSLLFITIYHSSLYYTIVYLLFLAFHFIAIDKTWKYSWKYIFNRINVSAFLLFWRCTFCWNLLLYQRLKAFALFDILGDSSLEKIRLVWKLLTNYWFHEET